MPLFLFLMLRPYDSAAALLATLVFAVSFGHVLFIFGNPTLERVLPKLLRLPTRE